MPSSTKLNPKETTMAMTLRLDKVLDDPIINPKTELSENQDRSGTVIESEGTGDSENGLCEKTRGEDNQRMKVLEVKAYVLPNPFSPKA